MCETLVKLICVCVCLYWPTRPEILWLNVEWQKMTKRSPSCQWKRNRAQQRQEIEGRCSHLFRLSCLQKRIFHHLQPSNRRRCCRSQCLAAVEVLSAPSKRGHPAMDGPTSELKSNNVDQSTTPWKSSNWFKLTVELDIVGSWTRPGHLWSCSGSSFVWISTIWLLSQQIWKATMAQVVVFFAGADEQAVGNKPQGVAVNLVPSLPVILEHICAHGHLCSWAARTWPISDPL